LPVPGSERVIAIIYLDNGRAIGRWVISRSLSWLLSNSDGVGK